MEESNSLIHKIVKQINTDLPLHSMWDGFWLHSFKRHTLIITCAFDSIYYRDFDIVFKQVIFFNVPERWRDTEIIGNDLLRLATRDEFHRQNPGFDIRDRFIFAIDIHNRDFRAACSETNGSIQTESNETQRIHTFFILARHIYLNTIGPDAVNLAEDYVDPISNATFPCFINRVKKK